MSIELKYISTNEQWMIIILYWFGCLFIKWIFMQDSFIRYLRDKILIWIFLWENSNTSSLMNSVSTIEDEDQSELPRATSCKQDLTKRSFSKEIIFNQLCSYLKTWIFWLLSFTWFVLTVKFLESNRSSLISCTFFFSDICKSRRCLVWCLFTLLSSFRYIKSDWLCSFLNLSYFHIVWISFDRFSYQWSSQCLLCWINTTFHLFSNAQNTRIISMNSTIEFA